MPTSDTAQGAAVKAIDILLVANNMTRRDFAAMLGESEFWLGRRMNSISEFKITDLERVAAIFGLTIDGLLALPDAIPTIRGTVAA